MKARMPFATIASELVQRTVPCHRSDDRQLASASKSSTCTENKIRQIRLWTLYRKPFPNDPSAAIENR